MRLLYNLVFMIFGIFYFPYLVVTKRYRYGMAERLGFLPERFKSICARRRIIWIHAVSLGEMKAAGIVAPLLRRSFPGHTIIFSSITHTGNETAKAIATADEGVFYLPLDLSFITDKVVKLIKPELFLLLEAELWPNLIGSLYRRGAKIALVNGRVSDNSYRGYKNIKPVISRILNKFSLISMQSERDAERMMALGAPKDRVFAAGNLKFDISSPDFSGKTQEIREKLGLGGAEILLIAGSTNKGEEEQVIDCFSRLKKDYSALRLLIAPRHVERTGEIERILDKKGFGSIRYSHIGAVSKPFVFILDTIGNLKTIYSAADIVFVGGSLMPKRGGQNPIEPASLSKPVIMGRFMANYQDIVRDFLENHAAIQVKDKDELYSAIKSLLDNPTERDKIGVNARKVVDKNSGSAQRTIEQIRPLLTSH